MDTVKLWIARDKDGDLYLHLEEPQRVEERGYFRSINAMKLPMLEYPEVTWENSPQQVELKLINK